MDPIIEHLIQSQVSQVAEFMEQGKMAEALNTKITCHHCLDYFNLGFGVNMEGRQLTVICPNCNKFVFGLKSVRAEELPDLIAAKEKKPWWKLW